MMVLLLLVFLGFLTVRGEEVQGPEEVQSPHIDPKLLGGRKTDVSIYPYQLSLQYFGLHACGASLIDRKWALTAAHCLDKTLTSFLSVRAGATGKENGGLVYNVKNKYVHQNYDAQAIDYDMALLELDEEVDPDYAETIPLPPEGLNVQEGDMGTVTGWGSTTEDGAMVYSLRVVEIPVLKQKDCKRVIGRYLTDRMFCAGYLKGGKDTCQGDSGGPFIVNGMQMGIVSWGYGCGKPRKPGIYTNVSVLRDFIRDVAGL